ncbi:MAG: hypothetical protein PHI86_05710 [Candidatus Omnitrophica bacterium]|nr:hypothetical protein [Candidatus Omnitrophota bacterium]
MEKTMKTIVPKLRRIKNGDFVVDGDFKFTETSIDNDNKISKLECYFVNNIRNKCETTPCITSMQDKLLDELIETFAEKLKHDFIKYLKNNRGGL